MKPRPTTDRVSVRAPAKVNLCLHVGARRADGFHDLESLVAFTDLGDELLLERSESLSLAINGPFAEGLSRGSDNLVMKAGQHLAAQTRTNMGARITLTKQLPLASGVGGGSADAAAALRGLTRLWSLDVPAEELRPIAAEIGSDVPVCVASSAAWMMGRGEDVRLLPSLPEISMVLVNPMVEVPTGKVFSLLKTRRGTGRDVPMDGFSDALSLVQYLEHSTNDLEAPAIELAPVIGKVIGEIARLQGVLLSRMSGSGATCFGIFATDADAQASAATIACDHPDWWVRATRIASRDAGLPRPLAQ
jgi:4-diphosphocytidyl-2-C-methyl-D-erythritol kinase